MARAKLPQYQVYLLRCWRETEQTSPDQAAWRFVLEHMTTRERHGFTDLASVMAFLYQDLEELEPSRNETPTRPDDARS